MNLKPEHLGLNSEELNYQELKVIDNYLNFINSIRKQEQDDIIYFAKEFCFNFYTNQEKIDSILQQRLKNSVNNLIKENELENAVREDYKKFYYSDNEFLQYLYNKIIESSRNNLAFKESFELSRDLLFQYHISKEIIDFILEEEIIQTCKEYKNTFDAIN